MTNIRVAYIYKSVRAHTHTQTHTRAQMYMNFTCWHLILVKEGDVVLSTLY